MEQKVTLLFKAEINVKDWYLSQMWDNLCSLCDDDMRSLCVYEKRKSFWKIWDTILSS